MGERKCLILIRGLLNGLETKIDAKKTFKMRSFFHASVIACVGFSFLALGEFAHAQDLKINDEWNFGLTNKTETFIVPEEGEYFLEVWGASGGDDTGTSGGDGGYTSGYIRLDVGDELKITVGGEGKTGPETDLLDPGTSFFGGYNGGGNGWANNGYKHASGGGMTDIKKGTNYLMVAGGGGGGDAYGSSKGGDGGGETGENAGQNEGTPGEGGTQTAGGSGAESGRQGKGGDSSTGYNNGGSGGGAGYYGGGGGTTSGGGGGSGYLGDNIKKGTMKTGENNGDGKAKITFVAPWLGSGEDKLVLMDDLITLNVDKGAFEYKTEEEKYFFKMTDEKLKELLNSANGADFMIDTPEVMLKIPHEVLKKLNTKPDGFKVFQIDPSKNKTKKDILDKIKQDLDNNLNNNSLKHSSMYQLKLFDVSDQDGNQVNLIKTFEKPLRIILKTNGFNNKNSTGVFYLEVEYDKNDYTLKSVSTNYHGGVFDVANNPLNIGFYTDHYSLFIVMERPAPQFTDIERSYAKEAILQLASLNILKGTDANKFGRNKPVKRVDFSIGLNIAMARLPVSYTATFNDVKQNDYFAGHVLSLHALGIPNIESENTFGVKQGNDYRIMTRLDAAIFLANAVQYYSKNHENYGAYRPTTPPFTDFLEIQNNAHQKAVDIVYQMKLFSGMPDGKGGVKFAPDENLTREQFAMILAKYLKITGDTFFRPLPQTG